MMYGIIGVPDIREWATARLRAGERILTVKKYGRGIYDCPYYVRTTERTIRYCPVMGPDMRIKSMNTKECENF